MKLYRLITGLFSSISCTRYFLAIILSVFIAGQHSDMINIQIKSDLLVKPSSGEQMKYLKKCEPEGYKAMIAAGRPYYTNFVIHNVPFEIDKYPVSIREYLEYCKKKNIVVPEIIVNLRGREDFLKLPAVGVSWTEADQYCRAKSKRLPRKTEYEYLMYRGAFYPFDIDDKLTMYRPGQENHLVPIGSNQFDINMGIVDIYSNTKEWTGDDTCNRRQNNLYGDRDTFCKEMRIAKKTAYNMLCDGLNMFTEYGYATNSRFNNLGFRCAVDIEGN